jgi:hypothetical protein
MRTGVQFTGTLAPSASGRWFTFGWPATWQVIWYMMPTSPQPGAPELDWDIGVERADAANVTYWITVVNRTGASINFEGRFAVLNG